MERIPLSHPPPAVPHVSSLQVITALMLREVATTHGRASLGFLWSVAEPAAGVMLLALIFSLAFSSPPLGESFALFYATGLIPFMAYLDISQKLSTAIRFSKQLLFYPAVTAVDALLARFFLNLLVQITVGAVILAGIVLAFGVELRPRLEWVVLAVVLMASLAGGIGALNCVLFALFPSYERLWAVLNRPLFVLSSILFVFEAVPEQARAFLWYNPLVHIVGVMRRGIYPDYTAPYASPLFVLAVALTTTTLALLLLRSHARAIIND